MKRLLLIFLLMALGAGTALAAPLSFLSDRDFAPYSMMQDGKPAGIDVEVFSEACKRAGVEYSLELVPWDELLRRFKRGECQGAFSLFRTPEWEACAWFVDQAAMHYSDYALFTRVGSDLVFRSWEDLQGKRIGAAGGFALSEDFHDAWKKGIFTGRPYKGEAACVGALLKGEIDAFAGQVDSTHYHLSRMGMTSTVVSLPKMLRLQRPAHIAFSRAAKVKGMESIANRLGDALLSMYRDGTYNTIARRYLFRF